MAASAMIPEPAELSCCGRCVYFRNAPEAIEAEFKGLAVMSSGYASVRAHDGLCDRHGVYLSYRDCCRDFSATQLPHVQKSDTPSPSDGLGTR